MDLNQILQNVLASTQASNQAIGQAANRMGGAAQNMERVGASNVAAAREDIPVAQQAAAQEADIAAQQQQLVQQLQAAARLNPDDANNAYVSGLARLTELGTQREAAHGELAKLASTDLLSDPLGYVLAQLKLPSAQAKAEALDGEAQRAAADVQTRLSLLTNAKNAISADTTEKLREVRLTRAGLAAREAERTLNMAEVETQAKAAGMYFQQVNALDKINDNTRQAFSMQMQVAQFKESQAERAEARRLRMLQLEDLLAGKKQKEDETAQFNAGLKAASKLLGYAVPVDVETYKRLPNDARKRALGELAQTASFGESLVPAITTFIAGGGNVQGIRAGGNLGLAQMMENSTAALQSYVTSARNTTDKLGKKPSDKEALSIGGENYSNALISAAKDPKTALPLTSNNWDKSFSPYKTNIGLVDNAVTAGRTNLTGNAYYETLKAATATAQLRDGIVPGDLEQAALRAVAERVAKGTLSADDAGKQIAQYYRVSAAANREFYQYELLGLPVQDAYIGKVNVPGFFGGVTQGRDLMNPVQAKMLVLEISKKQSSPVSRSGDLDTPVPPMAAGSLPLGMAGAWLNQQLFPAKK